MSRFRQTAFTLIELLVVMSIIALLMSIVAPRYYRSLDVSKEKALHTNLASLRDCLDKYYGDHGHYPARLETLVEENYIREIPVDPVTDSTDTWNLSPAKDGSESGVADVHSGAPGADSEGILYSAY